MQEIAVILLLNLIIYFKSIYNFYVTDDINAYLDTEKTKRPGRLKILWYALWGKKENGLKMTKYYHSQSAHLINICVHSLACVMVYIAFGMTKQAFIAALLFSINPFNNEISLWLSGKWYGITAIAVLLAWTIPILAPVVFFLAPIFSVSIIPTPLLFIFTQYQIAALLVIATLYLKWGHVFDYKSSKISSYCNHKEAWQIGIKKMVIFLKFYGYYFIQCMFAFKCGMFHKYNAQYLVDREGTDQAYKIILSKKFIHKKKEYTVYYPEPYFFIGIGLLWALWYFWSFNLFWFTVCIAPFCNFISVGNMLIGQRYAYLANVGVMMLVAGLPMPLPVFFGGWYLGKLFYVMRGYKNDYWSNEYQVWEEPEYYYSWVLHGNMWYARGHFGTALQDYLEACRINPYNFKVHYNISSCFIMLSRLEYAINAFEEAKKYDLLGQEQTKKNLCNERETLISNIFLSVKQKKQVKLSMDDVPVMV